MSYVLKFVTRPFRTDARGARINECTQLAQPPEPRIRLRIADCMNEINLEFSVECPTLRENSLHKVDTLLHALARFRSALEAEAELYAHREQHRR
jgi:hypothetical protein